VPRERTASPGAPAGSDGSDRRQEIVRIAGEVFAELGYSRTRIRDIANRAEILNGSLYHHFPGRDAKEVMLNEVLRPYMDEFVRITEQAAATDESPDRRLGNLIRSTLKLSAKAKSETMILEKDWDYLYSTLTYVAEGARRAERLWLSVLEEGVGTKVFRKDLDPRVVYHTIRGAQLAVGQWYNARGRINIDQLADIQTAIFLTGITA
jgi:TetR/AcrR family transcriptional regulator, cholesterol catabolism regulator